MNDKLNMNIFRKANMAARYIAGKSNLPAYEVGIILGSGLGDFADEIENSVTIPYTEIPYVPEVTVAGHAGEIICGTLGGHSVMAMKGRLHYYEGHSMQDVSFLVRVMFVLGVKHLIITNAAGGIGEHLVPGDLMLITDHINFIGANPLRGHHELEFGERFPDMSEVYSKNFREKALAVSGQFNLDLKQGVYAAMPGPSYETPAEIRMLRIMGADAVGMSSVPEAIVGNQSGMQVLGVSCVSNYAAGISQTALTHAEVLTTTNQAKDKFLQLLRNVIAAI